MRARACVDIGQDGGPPAKPISFAIELIDLCVRGVGSETLSVGVTQGARRGPFCIGNIPCTFDSSVSPGHETSKPHLCASR